MYLLNLPAFTFLAVLFFLNGAIRAYFIDSWKEGAATSVPFWKWSDWDKVWQQWKLKK